MPAIRGIWIDDENGVAKFRIADDCLDEPYLEFSIHFKTMYDVVDILSNAEIKYNEKIGMTEVRLIDYTGEHRDIMYSDPEDVKELFKKLVKIYKEMIED